MGKTTNTVQNIIIYHAGQCDPKKCTGMRLAKMKKGVIVRSLHMIPKGSLVLNPVSMTALSPSDKDVALKRGITALDCSWKQAEDVFNSYRYGTQRALPYLLAGNPINTYKPVKLSTAEAIAASLYILGFKKQALDVISVFRWGESFITLNKEWLEAYAACNTSSEVIVVQKEIMEAHSREV